MQHTIVDFPSGAVAGSATVIRTEADPAGAVVVLDRTPFHPVDHTWPDQPGDRGSLVVAGVSHPVIDAQMAATEGDGALLVGTDIPVKRGVDGWTWAVAHRLGSADVPAALVPGAILEAVVDAELRAGLSRGHTACHLAALALNAAVAGMWTKDAPADALGHPDFDARANQTSRITTDGSVDEYRLGKSLRRSGVDTAALTASLEEIRVRVDETLAGWVASAAPSRIDVAGPTIVDRRTWVCTLPEGEAAILCGGTHAPSLAEFASISVDFELPDPQTLVMRTTAVAAR